MTYKDFGLTNCPKALDWSQGYENMCSTVPLNQNFLSLGRQITNVTVIWHNVPQLAPRRDEI